MSSASASGRSAAAALASEAAAAATQRRQLASGGAKPAASSSSAASSRRASQASLVTTSSGVSACGTLAARRSQMSRGSSATSVAMSDTVSSAAAGQQQQRRPGVVGGALKKSSSSLSSTSTSVSQRRPAQQQQQQQQQPKSTTGLSFSGIRRPVSCVGAPSKATSASAQHSQRVPTLAVSQRDKDQQIKLLIKERDEQKFQAELQARRAQEWRDKFEASELERTHMTSEADDEVVELRRLAQEFEDENKRLAERLSQREQLLGDCQFKMDEAECERQELRRALAERQQQLDELEREHSELVAGARSAPELITQRQMSKAKYEREIEELKEKLTQKDESIMQLRSSLEMRKNEANNLQSIASDLERKLKIESERAERHLKRIDEINLELRAAEEKLATKSEENAIQEKQVKQLRQEVRTVEDRLEQLSLARKKDVDILHCKLSAARGGACRSATPTGSPQSQQHQQSAYKTPTPQDELIRLQMEIRDLKDQLIDREAELDCNRRDLEVIRRKMETRTLEVDCNNQELARRCQDLLEQNRQSEDTVKQLLKSTAEHSAQLVRATEDLKEANGKCIKLREEVNELEARLDGEMQRGAALQRENNQLKEDNQLQLEQIDQLQHQVDTLNEQLTELCEQLDVQTQNLHKDREQLADQLSEHEINAAQLRHDLATAKQDLRSNKLQTQEVVTERDRLRSDLDMKEKYIRSRNDIIEQMRHELDDSQKSLADCKCKLEALRGELGAQLDARADEMHTHVERLTLELEKKGDECALLRDQCCELETRLGQALQAQEHVEGEKFDEMRRKHSAELDELKTKLTDLERQLGERRRQQQPAPVERPEGQAHGPRDEQARAGHANEARQTQDYETQIEFLNSLVVDMQRKADEYKNKLASFEAVQLTGDPVDGPVADSARQQHASKTPTLKRSDQSSTNTVKRHVRIQDPVDGQISSLTHAKEHNEQRFAELQQQMLDELNGNKSANGHTPMRHISRRPFCDICQVYDLHHTIYCPRVSEKLAARHTGALARPPPSGRRAPPAAAPQTPPPSRATDQTLATPQPDALISAQTSRRSLLAFAYFFIRRSTSPAAAAAAAVTLQHSTLATPIVSAQQCSATRRLALRPSIQCPIVPRSTQKHQFIQLGAAPPRHQSQCQLTATLSSVAHQLRVSVCQAANWSADFFSTLSLL